MSARLLSAALCAGLISAPGLAAQSATPQAQTVGKDLSLAVVLAEAGSLAEQTGSTIELPAPKTIYRGQGVELVVGLWGNKIAAGATDLLCDYIIVPPKGAPSRLQAAPCGLPGVPVPANQIVVLPVMGGLNVEAGDPEGLWAFTVGVTDPASGARIEATASVNAVSSRGAP